MARLKINNRKDILLLLLYSPGKGKTTNEPIVGRTRIVKMLFLFQKEVLRHFRKGTEITEGNFYDFFAWDFGPFSTEVYDDITFFILRGFIESSIPEDVDPLPESAAEWEEWMGRSGARGDETVNEYEEEEFALSELGIDFAKRLYEELSESQRQLLRLFKAKLVNAPLRAILGYVYSTYPELTSRSKIKGQILGDQR